MKKRKLKLLLVTMLIFLLSAQPVLAAGGDKSVKAESENDGDVSGNDEGVSGNELMPEAQFYFRSATQFNNGPLGATLTDVNGNPVSTKGEPGKVKVICAGNFTDDRYKLHVNTIHYLERELGGNPHIEIIAGDPDSLGENIFRNIVGGAGFQHTRMCIDTDWFGLCQQVLATVCGCGKNDSIMFPTVYVVDSNNGIVYVSTGYSEEELASLVNYVKGMDEVTGKAQVTAFVNRLYSFVLNRQPDEGGLNDWVSKLMSKQSSGNDVAVGFFFSDELKMRNVSDSEFVELLYMVMMNRASDAQGKAYWVNMLNNGVSRMGVFNGFSGSAEFENICNSYGINRGTPTATEGRDKNYGATLFVARLYTQALGRNYDIDGLNDWCNRIVSGTWSITDVSTTGFFESPEFLNKKLNNEEYVKVLYRTFLGREYDQAGLNDWVGKLNSGEKNRTEVLKGFSQSPEFANIMRQFGL